MKKRVLSLLLCFCLLAGLPPTTAFAAGTDTGKAIQLGTGGISGYDSTTNSYDYIYFGNWSNGSVKWRVLDDQTNTWGDGLFLLSDGLLSRENGTNNGVNFGYSNTWQGSNAQSWCNDTFFFQSLLTEEQSAVLATTKSDKVYTISGADGADDIEFAASTNILSGDRFFFLSAEEADNAAYGFTDAAARIAYYGNSANTWWLRSPVAGDTVSAGAVDPYGAMNAMSVEYFYLARPAFNLDPDAVLFISAAVNGKVSGTGVNGDDKLQPVADYNGHEWKLTLLDSSRNGFTATTTSDSVTTKKEGYSDWNVEISYSGAVNNTAEQISALLCDSDSGELLYYGRIEEVFSGGAGTVNVPIPSGLEAGSYTLKVFNEWYRGDRQTDFASDFVDIPLTVTDDATPPKLTPGTVNRTSESTATVTFTSDEAGRYYYKVVDSGDSEPSIDTTGTGTPCDTTQQTISLTGLTADAKDIYIVVKDASGNVSDKLKMTIPAAPRYSISASPETLDFGSETEGYEAAPAPQAVTVTNTGNQNVTVTLPVSTSYAITAGTEFTDNTADLSPGGTATFTVQPNTGLAAGNHVETLSISGNNGIGADVELSFAVAKVYTLTVDLAGGSGSTAGGKYAEGDVININAGTRSDYRFTRWTSSNGGSFADASSAGTTFTMPAADTTITANWQYSVDTGKAVQIGANGISGYSDTNSYDYIYFGTLDDSPIKWRVLDDQTNTGGAGLFLLSDTLLGGGMQFNSSQNAAWQSSNAQIWCNSFYNTNLTSREQGAVLPTTKSDDAYTSTSSYFNTRFDAYENILSEDKVFFLSVAEVENGAYGFTDDGARVAYYGSSAGRWWLRSFFNGSNAGTVIVSGNVSTSLANSSTPAPRPAFNLNPDAVLFTSAAAGGKDDTTVDGGLTAISDYSDSEWKLTLKDDSRSFSVTETTAASAPGGTITLNYTGATAGTNEYISAIIEDSNGAQYYGRLKNITVDTETSGTVELTIPSDLAEGTYTLYVFSEQYNGDYKTDYASNFADISLTITVADTTAPTGEIKIAENGWKTFLNNITFALFFKDTQTVTITADDNSGETVTIEYLLSEKELTKDELEEMTFTEYSAPFGIDPDNEYVIYARLTDTSGNIAYINTDGMVLDATVPVISGIENGKTYCAAQTVTIAEKYIDTVTVNGKEVTLDSDNQFTLNPADGTQTVVVTDKAGNETTVSVTVNNGHKLTKTEAKAAICTEDGNTEYWTCETCGKYFSDAEGKTEISLSDTVIKATGHKLTKTEAKEATCTEDGNTEYWTCDACGKHFSDADGKTEITLADTIIEATGHKLTKTEAKAATCTEDGNTEYWTCENCGKHFSDAEGKTEIALTDTVIEATDHKLTKTEAKAATCTEDGNTEYWTCDTCGKYFSDAEGKTEISLADTVIKATGHELTHIPAKAACTEDGNIEYWYCETCGKYFSDAEGKTEITLADTVIEATGHKLTKTEAKAATCTEAGNTEYWTCETCGKYFSDAEGKTEISLADTIIEAIGHKLTHTLAKAATCTEAGNTEYWTCETCGKYFSDAEGKTEITLADTVIKADGHKMTHTPAKAACTEDGNIEYWYCDVCGKYFSDAEGKTEITLADTVIEATGHKLTKTEAKAATCTEDGNREYWTCDTCGRSFEDADCKVEITDLDTWKVIPKLDHTWSSDYLKEHADAEKHYHICTVCGTKDTGEVHTWNVEAATEETDKHCTVCGYVAEEKLDSVHTHQGKHISGKDATCTEEGSKEYYSCSCGRFFEDESCEVEITDLDTWKVIPKLDHTWSSDYLKEHADAEKHYHVCTVCGTRDAGEAHTWNVEAATEETDKHCTVCGYVAEAQLGHVHVGVYVAGKDATCTEEGSKEYYSCSCGKFFEDENCTAEITDLDTWKVIPKVEHTWSDDYLEEHADAERHYHVCTVCGTKDAGEDHIWNVEAATEETDKHCTVCGYVAEERLEHVHTLTHTADKDATCTEEGNAEYWTCDACGKHFSDAEGKTEIALSDTVIEATGHKLTKTEAKAATCTEDGNTEYWTCDTCGKHFSDADGKTEITLADTVIEATGHEAGTIWKSDGNGHWNECVNCGDKMNKAAHTYEWVTDKEPTAAEAGSRHEECKICGYAKAAVEIPATGTKEEPSEPSKPGKTPSGPSKDTNTPTGGGQTGNTTSPQTGDNSPIMLWIILLFISAGALGTTVYRKRKKQ